MRKNGKVAWVGTVIVAVHGLVNAAHAGAHWELGVELSMWQATFIVVVIGLCPLVAAVLLWTDYARPGAVILTGSMAAALVFGVYYHYVAISPDHVDHLPPGDGQGLFRASALFVAASQALGILVGVPPKNLVRLIQQWFTQSLSNCS